MPTYAHVQNGYVVNVITAESLEIAQQATFNQAVEYTEENPAAIGWAYDGTKFIAPVEESSNA